MALDLKLSGLWVIKSDLTRFIKSKVILITLRTKAFKFPIA